jgi:hypothetical protein
MDEKRDWLVTVRATVIKRLYCPECTEAEAKADPFDFASTEDEDHQEDWEVVAVEPVSEGPSP